MIPRWPIGRPSVAKRERLRFRNHPFQLAERMDPLFAGVLFLGALLLAGIWFFAVRLSLRMDRAPEAEVRLIKDERLLVNVRDNLPQKTMLDAVYHGSEAKIYLSQEGGQIHSYRPSFGRWDFEKPYGSASPVNPRFTMLQSGCGGLEPCPDGESLWAIGEEGGLVRRRNGSWELVVSDTAFIGADGEQVEREDLTSAAVSEDGIWLAVGTKTQGFGLYSLDRHRWLRFDASFFQPLNSLVIDQVVWWQGRFWFGGPVGLASLDMNGVRLHMVPDIEGAIADVDADPQGQLWVLEGRPCQTPGQNCQRLWTLAQPKAAPRIRLEEDDRFSELNLARQHFAMESGSQLFLAGETGVYGYHTELRRWERFHDHAVGPTFALPESGSFYFGFSGGVGWRNQERMEIWPLEGERFVRLTAGRDGSVLGLTVNGSMYEFKPGDDHRLIFSGKGTELNPGRFNAAVALGEQILLTGPDGALLHDVRKRTYRDIKKGPSMAWLLEGRRKLVSSGQELYVIGEQGNRAEAKMLSLTSVLDGRFDRASAHPELSAPLSGMRPWKDQGIGFIDGDGRVVQLSQEQTHYLTGQADPALDRETLVDVVDTGRDLLFATSAGWRIYDKQNRSWSDSQPSPSGSPIVEVTQVGGDVFMRDSQDRLVRQTQHQPVLIGDGGPSAIDESQLSDVWGDDSGFYMAGAGHLEYYDLGLRSITGRWRVPSGQTRILGEVASQPMALTSGTATWGDQILGPLKEKALNIFSDGKRVWTVRDKETHRYLRGHSLQGEESQCYFRRPTLGPEVTEITDVRTVGDDVIVASTNAGLRFYDPRARSWFQGPADVLPRGGWIFDLGEYVLFLERHQGIDRHWVVSRRTIRIPNSCSDEPVSFDTEVVLGRGTAVDQERRLFSWINTDGSVAQWRLGRVREILPTEPDAPKLSQAESWVFQKEDQSILVVVDGTLWRYAMSQRAWQRVEYRGADGELSNWNLANAGNVTILTALDKNGTLFLGELPAEANGFEWLPVYQANDQRFGKAGSAILDVQMHPDGSWAFLLRDSLRVFDPFQRRWVGNWSFPTGEKNRQLRLSYGRWICTEESSIWWVARENEGNPTGFVRLNRSADAVVALDENGQAWQLLPDGRLQSAAMPRGGTYTNFQDFGDKPFTLDSDQVTYALTWQGLLIFDLGGRLVAYDDTAMKGKVLPLAARNLKLVREPLIVDGDLWLLGEDRLVVLQQGASGNLIGFRFAGMRKVRVDRDGLVWGRDRRGWRLWRNGNFQRPGVREGIGTQDQIFCVEGRFPVSMAPDGSLSTWEQGRFVSENLTLPLEELPSSAWGIHKGDDRSWWAWGAFGVAQLQSVTCPNGNCLKLDKLWEPTGDSWPKNSDDVIDVRYSSANGLLLFAGNSLFLPSLNSNKLTETQAEPPKSDFAAENDWEDLQANTLKLERGGYVYNPITALANQEVSLIAKRPDGEVVLAERGEVDLKQGPSLQLDWLVWDPEKRGFLVKTPGGMTFFTAEEFIKNGHLLFEQVAAVIAQDDQSLVAANRFGLWRYGTRHLGLNQTDVTFTQRELAMPIRARGRVFETPLGILSSSGAKTQASLNETVQIGDIRLSPSPAGKGMLVAIGGQEQTQDPNLKGFPWDRNRQHLVWEEGRLQLVSDAGLHDLESLEKFRNLPQAQPGYAFNPDARNGIWFGENSQWFAYEKGSWKRKSEKPGKDATLVDRALWKWQATSSLPEVRLKEKNVALAWQNSDQGPGFVTDQLMDAMAEDKVFLVSSKAWLNNATQSSDLARFRGLRREKLDSTRLTISRNKEESWIRATLQDGSTLKWVRDRRRFEAMTDVSQSDVVWEDDRLRFKRTATGFEKRIRVGQGWVTFNMLNGRFPFDVITGIAADKDTLYVGSAAGLQVYRQPAGFRLTRANQWFGLANTGTARVKGFDQTRSELPLRVFTENGAYELSENGWNRQLAAVGQEARIRYQSSFWQWTQTARGTLQGRYQTSQGDSFPVGIRNGRWNHDRIRDIALADGRYFALWRGGEVSVGEGMALSSDWRNHVLDGNLREFVVLERELVNEQERLDRGMYVLGANKAYIYEQGRFKAIENSAEIRLLANYAASPPIYEREHLRLRQQSVGRLTFEYRDEDAGWKRMPWSEGGRLALDRIYHFYNDGEFIWAATDAGLVSFSRDGDGQFILQPHHFQLIENLDENQRARNISDIKIADDQFWVRCEDDSEAVYWASLSEVKNQKFQKVSDDPFAKGVFIDAQDSFWEWRWDSRINGSPGVLQATLQGEPVTLSAGRFHFDGVTSLAFLRPGILDYTTEAGGWFQTHRNNFNLRSVKRPSLESIDAAEIQTVSIGKRDDARGFCLERGDESFWWWVPEKEPEAVVTCHACVADDGYWQYEQNRDSLRIISDGRDGPLNERIMQRGRFKDDRVIGMPIAVAEEDGTHLFLPTMAGVLKLGEDLRLKHLVAGPFAGLPGDEPPSVLIQHSELGPLYLGQDGIHQLHDSQNRISGLPGDLPQDAFLERASWETEDILRLGWRTPTETGWHLLAKEDLAARQSNHLFINIANHDYFISRRLGWGDPEPWLVARYEGRALHLSRPGQESTYTIDLPQIEMLLRVQPWQDRLYVLGNRELLEVRLDRALESLFGQDQQHAAQQELPGSAASGNP